MRLTAVGVDGSLKFFGKCLPSRCGAIRLRAPPAWLVALPYSHPRTEKRPARPHRQFERRASVKNCFQTNRQTGRHALSQQKQCLDRAPARERRAGYCSAEPLGGGVWSGLVSALLIFCAQHFGSRDLRKFINARNPTRPSSTRFSGGRGFAVGGHPLGTDRLAHHHRNGTSSATD